MDDKAPDEQQGWLPPEPPGPPPPQPPPPPPPFVPPAPPPGMHPPTPPSPPPAGPPPAAAPPPGYPPPGYAPPPAGYPVYGWQPAPPGPPSPPNGDAVAGFTCSIIGLTLLFFSAGLSTIISLILGIVAVPYSRKGRRNVEEGRTTKHRDLAKAGNVIGIITVVLSLFATIAWVLLFALVDWEELEDEDGSSDDELVRAALRLGAGLARLLG